MKGRDDETDLMHETTTLCVDDKIRPVHIRSKFRGITKNEERRFRSSERYVHSSAQEYRQSLHVKTSEATDRVSLKNPIAVSADPPRTQERMMMSFS